MINIAKLLKDSPKGMKLYSPIYGDVEFKYIEDGNIIVKDKYGYDRIFSKDGKCFINYDSECLLFPRKDYKTWNGWTPYVEPNFKVGNWLVYKDGATFCGGLKTVQVQTVEKDVYIFTHGTRSAHRFIDSECRLWTIADAKDGDVLATDNGWTCIFQAFDGCGFSSYCFMDSQKWFCEVGAEVHTLDSRINGNIHPATKEQRDLLFAKMKEEGYEWDEKKKELRKIKPHYEIKNFHAGMPVLVRADNVCRWNYSVFSNITGNKDWQFAVCNGVSFTQCIPYEGNEHLLGTTDMCDEMYINW